MTRPTYLEYLAPSTWDREQRESLERYQRLIPGEFYTTTKLPMITPDNTLELVQLCRIHHVATTPMCWELCSGISRLTFQAYGREMEILFPDGKRYGWVPGNTLHLHTLKDANVYDLPSFTWASMPCKYWTQTGVRRRQLVTTTNRKAQAAHLHLTVWLTRQAWTHYVSVIF